MNKNKSFTLIELLVVIVIIGILAGVIMISTSSSIDKANFAKAQAFSSTVQNELLSNLVSEWTFDEPQEGNITKDTWGNNHGTVVGASQVDDCVFGKCYSFDGLDDYIEIADSREMRMNHGGTIAAWIYPKSWGGGGYGRLIDKSTGMDGENGYIIYFNSGYLKIKINAGTATTTSIKTNLNQWQFVTFIFNSSGRKIYVNGIEVTSGGGNLTELPPNIAGMVTIGNRVGTTDRTFNGLIDDFRVYNAALSSSQIKQNYIAGLNSMLANGNISKEDYNERINNLAYNDNNE
ncbi:MAG: LamG-like jellyroll fold domain-containing protein [Minisyncoccales bacterium]|jgi:prepilin-type N-terminal cleavage/methylation domain-containing protein